MLTMPFVEFDKAVFLPAEGGPPSAQSRVMASLVRRPAVYRRNEVRWVAACAWRSKLERRGLADLKRAKEALDPLSLKDALDSVAALVRELYGNNAADAITGIPCGHSKREDCFGKRLARAVADELGLPFVQVFADRPCRGSSHPKARATLPPLRQIAEPPGSLIVVDDVTTSGWHIEEMLVTLRHFGVKASAVAWISGTAAAEGDEFGASLVGSGSRKSPLSSPLPPLDRAGAVESPCQ